MGAANPLIAELAETTLGHKIKWCEWTLMVFPPGFVAILLVPLLVYVIYPPYMKASPHVPQIASEALSSMGPMSRHEKIMAVALSITVFLWIFGAWLGVNAIAAAIAGLSILFVFGIVTWQDCLKETAAWDMLTWLSALIALVNNLNKYGLVEWAIGRTADKMTAANLPWLPALIVLLFMYFYIHYLFSSAAAHIGAMYTAFVSLSVALGCPKEVAAYAFAMISTPMCGLTHYGIATQAQFYATRYVYLSTWWMTAFIVASFNFAIQVCVGLFWWKLLGYW